MMTFDHVGSDSLKGLFRKFTGGQEHTNIITTEAMKTFYGQRIQQLESQADELEEKQKVLEQEINQAIQEIFFTKGTELLITQQIFKVTCKEIGACELKLEQMEEEEK